MDQKLTTSPSDERENGTYSFFKNFLNFTRHIPIYCVQPYRSIISILSIDVRIFQLLSYLIIFLSVEVLFFDIFIVVLNGNFPSLQSIYFYADFKRQVIDIFAFFLPSIGILYVAGCRLSIRKILSVLLIIYIINSIFHSALFSSFSVSIFRSINEGTNFVEYFSVIVDQFANEKFSSGSREMLRRYPTESGIFYLMDYAAGVVMCGLMYPMFRAFTDLGRFFCIISILLNAAIFAIVKDYLFTTYHGTTPFLGDTLRWLRMYSLQ